MRNGLIGLMRAMALGLMATAGCGSTPGTTGGTGGNGSSGSGGTGGGSSVTTLSGGKAVGALTMAEATQLCNDTYAYFGTAIPKATSCKWKGLIYAASSSAPSQSALQQACTTKETSCLSTDPWANNPGCSDIPSTCTATVAEYSACISDEVAAFIPTVNGLPTCPTLTSTLPIIDAQTAGTPPASCTSLGDKCPDLSIPSPLIQ